MISFWDAKQTTYKRLFKTYPQVTNLWRDDENEKPITAIIEHYEKHGSRWILTDSETEKVNHIFYYNTVDPNASAFFRNLGGYERTTCSYTRAGYIPTECISISPDRENKTVRKFVF
jgi:hypothetical protein